MQNSNNELPLVQINNNENPLLQGYISNMPDDYNNLNNLYKNGTITADELQARANTLNWQNQDDADKMLMNQYKRNFIGGAMNAASTIPYLTPAGQGALFNGGMHIINGGDYKALPLALGEGAIMGKIGGKLVEGASGLIGKVANRLRKPSEQALEENLGRVLESMGGDAIGGFPAPKPNIPEIQSTQIVYHGSPQKNIRQFNPADYFGFTDEGFYAKNATYFTPEIQNAIPYATRTNASNYLRNPDKHSKWSKDFFGYLLSNSTDVKTGTINKQRLINSLDNEIEFRNNIGENDKVNELLKIKSDYNNNTTAGFGSIYKTEIPADKYLLDFDKKLSEQTKNVKRVAELYNIPASSTGEALYNNLLKYVKGDAKMVNDILIRNNIRGFKGGESIGVEKGVFNPNDMKILDETSVLDPKYKEYLW